MVGQSDTLFCDTTRLAYWQGNPAYDYNRELQTPDLDLCLWLRMQLEEWFGRIFGNRFAQDYTEPILIVLFVVIILLLVWFVYRKRPELFMRTGKKTFVYTVSEDTIYGVDFDSEIKEALAGNDYREAIRLLYLQTLKQLTDKGVIDWQLYKTSTQYVYEVKPEVRRDVFRRLTNHFLRIRYGNFEATKEVFEEMAELQKRVGEGL